MVHLEIKTGNRNKGKIVIRPPPAATITRFDNDIPPFLTSLAPPPLPPIANIQLLVPALPPIIKSNSHETFKNSQNSIKIIPPLYPFEPPVCD